LGVKKLIELAAAAHRGEVIGRRRHQKWFHSAGPAYQRASISSCSGVIAASRERSNSWVSGRMALRQILAPTA